MHSHTPLCHTRCKSAVRLGVALSGIMLCLPQLCFGAEDVDLTVGTLIDMAAAVMPLIYVMVALFIALMAGNAVSLISVWQLPSDGYWRKLGELLDANDYTALRTLSGSHPKCIVGRSVCAGIKNGADGHHYLDKSAVLASFQALADKFYLSPRALKAFGLIVLLVCIWGLGAELVRFYTVLYERMAVVVGNYPFRKLFQEGSARLMVLAMGGLSVSVAALISGFVFSGAVRAILIRKTSVLVQLLSEENHGSIRFES